MSIARLLLVCLLFLNKEVSYSFQVKGTSQSSRNVTEKIALNNSVLAKGNWYKFYVNKTGVYKITPDFLADLGIDVSNINIQNLKIYGNGGQMLPLLNKDNHQFDLLENPIKIIGGADGVFSAEDYILFYAIGTSGYNKEYKTHINLYDNNSYYYITTDGSTGKRIEDYKAPKGDSDKEILTFADVQFHEKDEVNIANMGRRWFEHPFGVNQEKEYKFYFPNLVTSKSVKLKIKAATATDATSSLGVKFNNDNIGTMRFPAKSKRIVARDQEFNHERKSAKEEINGRLSYQVKDSANGKAYTDYIAIEAERLLKGTGKQMPFEIRKKTNKDSISKIVYSEAKNVTAIWEVTDPFDIRSITNSNRADVIKFKTKLNANRKYLAIVPTDFYTPMILEQAKVKNQDLKGTVFLDEKSSFKDIDYLIITSSSLELEAIRLANHRRQNDRLSVKVVTVDKIYNEFSSGKQDVSAIRNFVRYVYDNASEDKKRLRFLCLFGDATIDYKNVLNKQGYKHCIPSFETYNSFSMVGSYVSDDFYGSLDPEEGDLLASETLDIAVGRIVTESPSSAKNIVSKIINYDTKASRGSWKNNMLLMADDVDKSWEKTIQENLDKVAKHLSDSVPFLNLYKVYSDAYIQNSSSSGERYPQVRKELIKRLEKGVSVVNYFGHAGVDGFSSEFIFTKKDAKRLKHRAKLPLWITVTCLATGFDNPLKKSVGEEIFCNPEGGAIGMITTTREIHAGVGVRINKKLMELIFESDTMDVRPAEAVMVMKNGLSSNEKRIISFVGDPAMKLHLPKPGIRLTKLNNLSVENFRDTLKALDKVRFVGEIVDARGKRRKNFQGTLTTTIFDKEIQKQTLANNHVKQADGKFIRLDFKEQGALVCKGDALISKGKFDFELVIPKDIRMAIGACKISFYAIRDTGKEELQGAYQGIKLGGLKTGVSNDKKGPKISMSFKAKTKLPMPITNGSPQLMIKLKDVNGINVSSSGIGHEIKMIIDGNDKEPIILNDDFKNEINAYTEGVIHYQLNDLKEGFHQIEIKAWDTLNNFSAHTVEFFVDTKFYIPSPKLGN